ncbi:MAG: glycerol-3-phosphate acyltransferase [Chloroflexota bacterium]|nr:glycerol-3-phosphate acyltransferase [Chloroflexota bacterium]
MTWRAILLFISAYLLGSIPTAYLAGRWLHGIDVRQYGTGNVGGSNVWHSVARWAVVPVGLFDVCKAALPAWLALGPLNLGYSMAVISGLCAAVGHAWPIYLGFTGGRALSSILGTLAVVFPWGALIQLLVMGLGLVLHIEHLTNVGLLAMPLLSLIFDRPPAVTWGCVAMIILTAVKRVDANRTPLPPGPERWKVIGRRLWLDRDILSHEEWVARGPAEIQPVGEGGNAG